MGLGAGARLSVESTVNDSNRAHVERGLWDHAATLGIDTEEQIRLAIWLHDANGNLVGGLVGGSLWSWLEIRMLWVDAAVRDQGHGTALLQATEATARARGCIGARLEAYDPAALRFYQRRGFGLVGTIPDYPPGHTRFILVKRFG